MQYQQFSDGFDFLSALAGGCPACAENFRSVLCDLSCGGDQATFFVPTSTAITPTNGTVVTGANVSISLDVVHRLYDSCVNVQLAAEGQSLFHAFGVFTAEEVFTGLIDSHSPVAYNWQFKPSTDPTPSLSFSNLHRDLFRCDNFTSNLSCSCGDCPTVCNRCPVHVTPNDTRHIVDGSWPSFGHNYLHPIVYACMIGMSSYVGAMVVAAAMAQAGEDGTSLSVGKKVAGRVLVGFAGTTLAVLLVYVVSVIWIWAVRSQPVTIGMRRGWSLPSCPTSTLASPSSSSSPL